MLLAVAQGKHLTGRISFAEVKSTDASEEDAFRHC